MKDGVDNQKGIRAGEIPCDYLFCKSQGRNMAEGQQCTKAFLRCPGITAPENPVKLGALDQLVQHGCGRLAGDQRQPAQGFDTRSDNWSLTWIYPGSKNNYSEAAQSGYRENIGWQTAGLLHLSGAPGLSRYGSEPAGPGQPPSGRTEKTGNLEMFLHPLDRRFCL